MEIKNSPDARSEILELPEGSVEILNGGLQNIFLRIKCRHDSVGDILENLVEIVLSEDAKLRNYDEVNTNQYVDFNKSFVKQSLEDILKNETRGDSVRLSGNKEADGSYSVTLVSNWSDRTLPSKENNQPSFKEWFLEAVKNYGDKN